MNQFTYPDGITIVEENGFIVRVQDFEFSEIRVFESALIQATHQEISEYLAGTREEFTVPYKLIGTDFQIKVWEAIAEIPYGQVRSYRVVAEMIHHPRSARAVGTACRLCPLAYLIPCQRVVSSTGIGGFGRDLDLKRQLLDMEFQKSGFNQ